MKRSVKTATIPVRGPLFRGDRQLRIALVGLPGCGKSTFFRAVQSTAVRTGALAGTRRAYDECAVEIGLDQARESTLENTLAAAPSRDLIHPGVLKYMREIGLLR